jgi:hypothetical protein
MFGSVEYRCHVQDYGWLKWTKDGGLCGTTPTLTEDDMRIITDGTRTALVGPGYLSTLDTPEAVDVTKALVGSPVVVGNARQYDVWVAACTQGRNVTAPTVTADALQAAIRGALTGLIGGAK